MPCERIHIPLTGSLSLPCERILLNVKGCFWTWKGLSEWEFGKDPSQYERILFNVKGSFSTWKDPSLCREDPSPCGKDPSLRKKDPLLFLDFFFHHKGCIIFLKEDLPRSFVSESWLVRKIFSPTCSTKTIYDIGALRSCPFASYPAKSTIKGNFYFEEFNRLWPYFEAMKTKGPWHRVTDQLDSNHVSYFPTVVLSQRWKELWSSSHSSYRLFGANLLATLSCG